MELIKGFQVAFQFSNLFACFIGVSVGTLVGVLPGIGPMATIAILLPITFKMTPVAGVIMLAGIYYGAMYGGSTTSILVNIPGEAASVVTCIDGYQMAKKGRAGPALGIAAFGSFIAGTAGVVGLMIASSYIAELALKFGPPENTALMTLGLVMVTYLSSGSTIKSLMMASAGLLLGCIGTDLITGTIRFWSGFPQLTEGLGIVPVAMGLFGLAEVLTLIENKGASLGFLTTGTTFLPSQTIRKQGPLVI
jgi:putative tricarboxylic transport membrane protein